MHLWVRLLLVPVSMTTGAGLAFGCAQIVGASDLVNVDSLDATKSSDGAPADGGANDGAPPDGQDGGVSCAADQIAFEDQCIDKNEVTVGQYALFVAQPFDSARLPTECKWKTTHIPPYDWPGPTDRAVSVVDWCDAFVYCAWNHRRLCGKRGGGAVSKANAATLESQWYSACSHNGDPTRIYPYGTTYDPTACNTDRPDGAVPGSVDAYPKCVGGYDGLLNMSGNVNEWEDSCTPSGGDAAADECLARGGPFNFPGDSVQCAQTWPAARGSSAPQSGFRCCSL